jgi:hypothetical protein
MLLQSHLYDFKGREQRKAREMVMEEVKERRVKKEIKATGKAKERVKERVTKAGFRRPQQSS